MLLSFCCSMLLQVDLGGWLSQRGGLLYHPAAALGLADALLEALLLSVVLVKDEVEQQRFRVSWCCCACIGAVPLIHWAWLIHCWSGAAVCHLGHR
jgi:hypothetical protein